MDKITAIIAGITMLIGALTAWYTRGMLVTRHEQRFEGHWMSLYLSRQSVKEQLVQIHKRAEPGDTIWGQCVNCSDFPKGAQEYITNNAANGVKFQIIVNDRQGGNSWKSLYEALSTAKVVASSDNSIRVYGRSDKEVALVFSDRGGDYEGIFIRDTAMVQLVRSWFDERFIRLWAARPQ